MKVDVLYFAGCPHHKPAVALVRDVAADLGLEAEVEEVEVNIQADAERHRFLGSPTIQVDGLDVEPAARDRHDYAFSCRMYAGQGTPPRDMLAAALLEAATAAEAGGTGHGCCEPAVSSDAAPTSIAGQRAGRWAVGGSVVSALAASACCWIPLLLIALGISAATGYYRSIARKTAALVQSVATNHGFSDGNKRTSVILMHTPLTKRGYKLVPLPTDKSLDDGVAEEMVLDVVNHRLDFDGLVAWFKARIGKR